MPAKRIIDDDSGDEGGSVAAGPAPVPSPPIKRARIEEEEVNQGLCSDDEEELVHEMAARPTDSVVTVVIKNLSQLIQVVQAIGKEGETMEFTVVNHLAPITSDQCCVASIPGIQCNAQLDELAAMVNDQRFTKNQTGILIEYGTGTEFYNFFINAEAIEGLPEGEKITFHLLASRLFTKLTKASDKSSEVHMVIQPNSIDFITYRRDASMSFNKIRVARVDVTPPAGRVSELVCAFDNAASGSVEEFMHAVRQGDASNGVCEVSIETIQMKGRPKLRVFKVTTYVLSEQAERSSKAWIVEDDSEDSFHTVMAEQIADDDDDDEEIGREMEEQMRIADITDTLSKEVVGLDGHEDDRQPNLSVKFDIGDDGRPVISKNGANKYCRVAVARPLVKRLMTFLDAFQSRKTHFMALLNSTDDLLCVLIPTGLNWALVALPGRCDG